MNFGFCLHMKAYTYLITLPFVCSMSLFSIEYIWTVSTDFSINTCFMHLCQSYKLCIEHWLFMISVHFRFVVFRPFMDEVVVAKIRSCSKEGVHGKLHL